jgi:squalene-hopene/tetraprenyl-beta-curcumene cyclase
MSAGVQQESLLSATSVSLDRAAANLVSQQDQTGYWCAELTADTTLESDDILLQLWMHPPEGGVWQFAQSRRVQKAVASILGRQLPDGGFNTFFGGPAEISATVKAYFALKVAGVPVTDPRMASARERILELGGLQNANSYVKVNLSLFDLYPREHTPSIPPELMLLPGKIIYQMSSWTRAIVIALAIVHSSNPKRPVPSGFDLDELILPGASMSLSSEDSWLTLRNTFVQSDKILKLWEKYGIDRIRGIAIRKCEHWMVEHLKHSDGLGAIYPSMMYAIMAFDVLGYPKEHPMRLEAIRVFDHLIVDDVKIDANGDKVERYFFQPCFSPVWDSAISAYALGEAGRNTPALRKCADWLLSKEIRRKGDWSIKRPNTEPSGWAFEFRNDHYPDIDDTAMVLLSFVHARATNQEAHQACERRALNWLLAMQGRDGGWAAFDVDNNWEILTHVPFADHNAMLDPTCPDITGRVLEALAAQGLTREHPAVQRGVDYLIRNQSADGSWFGRWGVAYIYGTCFALRGLAAAMEDDHEPHVQRGNEWLRSIQNADGGWGESCASYDSGIYASAPSTPSQTAWAILGLIAGGDTRSSSVQHGIEYLLDTQRPDGNWDEELATGTGFPKVFYLNYHLYSLNFPLMALAAYQKAKSQ